MLAHYQQYLLLLTSPGQSSLIEILLASPCPLFQIAVSLLQSHLLVPHRLVQLLERRAVSSFHAAGVRAAGVSEFLRGIAADVFGFCGRVLHFSGISCIRGQAIHQRRKYLAGQLPPELQTQLSRAHYPQQ